MKLIDKDALVAEIERRIKEIEDRHVDTVEGYVGMILGLKNLLPLLDTLEVKEEDLLTEEKNEKELAGSYINLFDKKFGNKLPNLKGKQLAEFKNLINTCEQTFYMKYFDYHATQGKLFEKLALLWAAWGKEHLRLEVKEVDLEKEYEEFVMNDPVYNKLVNGIVGKAIAKHFFELGLKTQKG